jgi:hypothetical protein
VSFQNWIDVTTYNVIAIGNDGSRYAQGYLSAGELGWSGPNGSGLLPSPAATVGQSNVQRSLAVANNGAVFSWDGESAPVVHAGINAKGSPAAALDQFGQIEAFVFDSGGSLWSITEKTTGWEPWVSHGAPASTQLDGAPAVAPNQAGLLELFAISSAGELWHIWQNQVQIGKPGAQQWAPWYSHGKPPGTQLQNAPAMAKDSRNCLEVFSIGADGQLWFLTQTSPNGGWSGWSSLFNPPGVTLQGSPTVSANSGGLFELFAIGSDGGLWHIWQTQLVNNAYPWSPWYSHLTP